MAVNSQRRETFPAHPVPCGAGLETGSRIGHDQASWVSLRSRSDR